MVVAVVVLLSINVLQGQFVHSIKVTSSSPFCRRTLRCPGQTLRRTIHLSEEMGVLQHYTWPLKQPTLEERIERQEEWMSTLQ